MLAEEEERAVDPEALAQAEADGDDDEDDSGSTGADRNDGAPTLPTHDDDAT